MGNFISNSLIIIAVEIDIDLLNLSLHYYLLNGVTNEVLKP